MSKVSESPFSVAVTPDWEAFRDCIMRKGTPNRVHHIELFLDHEIQEAIWQRYHLLEGLDADDPAFPLQRMIRVQRFLGYDYVRQGVDVLEMPLNRLVTEDTAEMGRKGGRSYVDETRGPITSWEEFEQYPWPDPAQVTTRALEWYDKHLPDDMCIIGSGGFAHFAEYLTWLMGYETLCFALYDQRDLVQAIADRLMELFVPMLEKILAFDRVKIVWGSDDMGFKVVSLPPRTVAKISSVMNRASALRWRFSVNPRLMKRCTAPATLASSRAYSSGFAATGRATGGRSPRSVPPHVEDRGRPPVEGRSCRSLPGQVEGLPPSVPSLSAGRSAFSTGLCSRSASSSTLAATGRQGFFGAANRARSSFRSWAGSSPVVIWP